MKLSGGTKYTLAFVIIVVFLFVMVWLAVSGRLEAMLAGILVGGITAVKGIFDAANTANNRAALEAGKKAEDAETARLAGMSDPDVLAAAGATGSVNAAVDGVLGEVRSGVDAARAEVSRNTDDARERLRRAATGGTDNDGR